MSKLKLTAGRSNIVLALTALLASPAIGAESTTPASALDAERPDQMEFPIITLQPLNQLVPAGSNATFQVGASHEPLGYQWLRNDVIIPGATNSGLIISNAGIAHVGIYSCNVSRESEVVPTRGAQLMVYTRSAGTGRVGREDGVSLTSGTGPVTVWSTPVTSGGSSGTCPGDYEGYVSYTKSVAEGWGWAPSSDTTNHTATDTTRSDTKVQYKGKLLDAGCDQTTVAVPHPAHSSKYRFTIYFPNNVPTNAYPIELDGFDP